MVGVENFDRPEQQAAWEARLAAAPGGHLLQSWAWGELKASFGWRVERLAAGRACAQVLYRRLPAGLGTLAYVPRGPAATFSAVPESGVEGEAELQALLAVIKARARQRRAVCLKIEPDVEDSPTLAARLRALGFRPSPQAVQPRRTLRVDLQAEPEALLAAMKQKTRYNIRLAARKGVAVRAGDEADLPAFYRLLEVTARRDGFGIHTAAYYQAAHHLLVTPGHGCLLLAEREGQLLAGLVAAAWGDTACYLYGASADEGRALMPTYLLQWQAMLWARQRGCRSYDLWGVPDEDEAALEAQFEGRSDGLWGVYRFKRGFGGRLVRTVGAWDQVYALLRYRLYELAVAWLERRRVG
jgi:lipid II:glycine glycyltransferase (peptidoglycan interpeptide bridge formation enzyme)